MQLAMCTNYFFKLNVCFGTKRVCMYAMYAKYHFKSVNTSSHCLYALGVHIIMYTKPHLALCFGKSVRVRVMSKALHQRANIKSADFIGTRVFSKMGHKSCFLIITLPLLTLFHGTATAIGSEAGYVCMYVLMYYNWLHYPFLLA